MSSPPPTSSAAATRARGDGVSRARPVTQGGRRSLAACKELFFAGFPCAQPYQRHARSSSSAAATPAAAAAAAATYSKSYVRGFFQQYGPVEAIFYDEARGMGSVVFSDGADAESCYVAVHLSLLTAPDEDGGTGRPTWDTDELGEAVGERRARAPDLLLCLEFAQCCPFVNPVLLTRDSDGDGDGDGDGDAAHVEVPGGELSRAVLLHRFPVLLRRRDAQQATAAKAAPQQQQPVAPHVVVRWAAETVVPRVQVLEDDEDGSCGGGGGAELRRVRRIGPHFPGRGIEPAAVEEALWQLLQPTHIPAQEGSTVTVMELWWVFYNLYHVHKTQPSADRIVDAAYDYAEQPSLVQEVRAAQRQSREYAHGDEAAAQQIIQRLVHDHIYHSALCYIHVKQKLKCDPVWASLMRDVYTAKVLLHVQAWRALTRQSSDTAAPSDVHHRRAVKAAIAALIEPAPTRQRDVDELRAARRLWRTMPRTTTAANLVVNVTFLEKVKRGEVDRSGHDRPDTRPPLPSLAIGGDGARPPKQQQQQQDPSSSSLGADTAAADYPSMSAAQRDEQLYAALMQNVDGYVAIGAADELVGLCEDPKLFRYAKGHIGYEEAHRRPSYWRAYVNALWVPLIAMLLLGFGTYYVVDRLGLAVEPVKKSAVASDERGRHVFHSELRRFLDQQRAFLSGGGAAGLDAARATAAMREMNETMRRASEAAAKAGGHFRIELRHD
ncbi:hypothetical protein NESM_000836000 [Novymonas esmeraldas]|uniref:Uncharacterized protein n=1 Tax=Novymonas esmeraldas TaxID=1808958 RepID=A0AAW0F0L5_9TRYP